MKSFKEFLTEGRIETHVSNGVKYQIMIDSSRFGTVYRLWKVEGLGPKDLPPSDEGYSDIKKIHAQAEDLIIKHFSSKGIKPKVRW